MSITRIVSKWDSSAPCILLLASFVTYLYAVWPVSFSRVRDEQETGSSLVRISSSVQSSFVIDVHRNMTQMLFTGWRKVFFESLVMQGLNSSTGKSKFRQVIAEKNLFSIRWSCNGKYLFLKTKLLTLRQGDFPWRSFGSVQLLRKHMSETVWKMFVLQNILGVTYSRS